MSRTLDESLVDRIIRLSPDKRMALEQRMTSAVVLDSRPAPRENVTTAPASFGQRSQWFVHQLDRGNPFFNKTDAVRIRGGLDTDALQRAVSGLVTRHAVLRTSFRATDDGPIQVVNPPIPIELPIVEIPPGRRQMAELHRLLAAEQRRPFDLATGPMYRTRLFRLGPDDHVLARTNHHIAFDRWSSAIANSELSELYRAFSTGETPRLAPLPYQYSDFAQWQRSRLDPDTMKRHLQFAEAHLAGVPQVLDLPTDRPRPAGHGHRGTSYSVSLDSDLVRELRRRARSEGATPFMVCLAAFAVLIGRYARTDHFLVGVPSAGRHAAGSDALIGLFINSMVMRLDLRGDPSFSELVARVRAAALGVMSHQDLPFDVLVEHLAAERIAGRTPMFQVMLDYINTPASELQLGSLDLEPVRIADEASVYDVNLYLFDDGDGIDAKWEYRSDLFDRPTIVRMSEAYMSVLRAAVSDPGQATTALPLMSTEDRTRIRSLGTGPTADIRDRPSFLDAIQGHATRHPESAAIVADGIAISYQQLWELAVDVSSQITSTCPEGALVAIQTGRSIEFVPSLLGVLHSGRTAVMVDPSQPARRMAAMLEQIELDATITTGADHAPRVEVHRQQSGATSHRRTADDSAYVVFTSGSTGAPRPVVLGRAGLENFVADARERYALVADDRVLQFASTGFDTILEEVLPTLSSGATLVMRPRELFSSFADFTRFVRDHRITVLDLPTAWWHAWTDDLSRTDTAEVPESVRLVIIGGEAARTDRWRAWQDLTHSRIRLVNTYGPSETTVVVATFEPPHDWSPVTDVIPIGLPIRNATLLVVDEAGHVVPPGVPGELVIEGAPVGHGYLHSSGISGFPGGDPGSGGRRYPTGDLARVSVDGIHEFLGRIDDQLKISGIRIEPGEIEAALRSHPAVDDAVVIGVDSAGGDRLVAHVVLIGSPDLASIRRHLQDRLPEPMIPGSIVVHPSLPVTTSGKIDRMALRDATTDGSPQVEHPEPERPPTPTEVRLIRVWESVMARTAVQVDDDFFAVGGHSLLGVRLISHATDEFGVELPLRILYEAPTVAGMARWIDELLGDADPRPDSSREETVDHVGA